MNEQEFLKNEVACFETIIEKISKEMVFKFRLKQAQGFGGWCDKENKKEIIKSLKQHIKKGFDHTLNIVDCMNLLTFLYVIRSQELDEIKQVNARQ